MDRAEKLLFEQGAPGREGIHLPEPPAKEDGALGIDRRLLRSDVEGFPELSEVDVVRHFTRLSRWNTAVDIGMYPLGSCTMKYNPKMHERLASLPGFTEVHPLQPEDTVQGCLRLMHGLERELCAITGMDHFTLQPSAGAQGELVGMKVIRACLRERGDPRRVVLIPDSAHGTNPASARLAGYEVESVPTGPRGTIDIEVLRRRMRPDVAALMVTNPNTLGVFEDGIVEVVAIVHGSGGLVYHDGANMNALLGKVRPGDTGVDVLHLNLHKTFSTPHGGGGPGAGPVGVRAALEPYLPVPRVVEEAGHLRLCDACPRSIGRVHSFQGNFGILVRAYAYIRSLGAGGLAQVSEQAVLNTRYLKTRLSGAFELAVETDVLHEVVFSDRSFHDLGISTLDVAKRLLDFGFHPPTIYFPLIVAGALMIEPTECESRQELDTFVEAMLQIREEAEHDPQRLKSAPQRTPVRRLDEVAAARHPRLRWRRRGA
ncbi:MAG: aminomethyl-transferring glycine dehydrogenase subunit GcvPB [Acidobacteriota bacterium]